MAADDPELQTTDEWRASMFAARKAAKLTQAELGDRVGTSQAVIWAIEKGPGDGVAGSKFVLPICRVLEIDPPFHHTSEEMQLWSKLGFELHAMSPRRYAIAVELVRDILDEMKKIEVNGEDSKSPSPPASKRPKRKQ